MSRKKSGEKKESQPKISSERKDLIVKTVHEKVRAFKAARPAAVKERAAEAKNWLEQQPEVESVILIGESDITVKFKDGTRVGIMLNRKDMFGGGDQDDALVETSSAYHIRTSNPQAKGDPHPISNKACVIDTLYDDWPGTSTPDSIVNTLKRAGYEVDLIKANDANLKFFSNLDDEEYGIVFIMTHGGMMNIGGDNKVHIMARPFFTSFPSSSGYTGVEVLQQILP